MKWQKRLVKIGKWLVASLLFLILSITALIYIFKDDIIDYALTEINKYLEADVYVGKIDVTFWSTFPNLSLDFNHVFVQDVLPESTRKDTLLYTDQIRLKFNPIDVWNENYEVKKVQIKPGTLQLKVNEKGEDNYHIFKESQSSETSAFKLSLESITAAGMRFVYTNRLNNNTYKARFDEIHLKGNFTQDQFDIDTDAKLFINKVQNGLVPFVLNQHAETSVAIHVDQIQETFEINNGKLLLSGIPFDFNVHVDQNQIALNIDASKIPLAEIANKLAIKEANAIDELKGSGFANFHLRFKNKLLKDSYPNINCSFEINNGQLTEPIKGLTLRNINLNGVYSTEKGKMKEELRIQDIRFQTVSGPFSGNISLVNFSKPTYKGNAKGSLDLEVMQAIFRLPKIETLSGKIDLDTRFHLETVLGEQQNSIEIVDGSGTALLHEVAIQLKNDSRIFSDVSGNLILNRNEALLEALKVRLGESDMEINGTFKNIDLFLQDKQALEIAVITESKKINLRDFTNTTAGDPKAENSPRDWMLPTQINGTVKLNVNSIQLNQHVFTQISGEMSVGNRSISIQKLHGITANATVIGTLGIFESAPEYFELATSLSSKDIYFKPVFREWNNFDQTVIREENISGRAEAILDLKAPFDLRYGVLKDEIEAQIQLKIFAGQLKNVETFTTLSKDLKTSKAKLVLKPRDIDMLERKLKLIEFETLENTIFVKKGTVIVPKMEIKSSALDISLDAKHQFNNNIDYKFAFRFRELKSQKDESEFGIVEDDGTGIKIFVRMSGNLSNPVIEWDKTTRQDDTKQNREDAKQEALSILKSELGLFKKDSTVKKFQPQRKEHEVLEIQFGKEEKVNPYEEKKELEKEKKGLKKLGEKLKEKTKEEKEEFTIE